MYRIESYGGQPFSGCVTSHSSNEICINRITSFLLHDCIHFNFVFSLILLLKISDFEKKICTVCNVIWDFIVFFKVYRKLTICSKWRRRCRAYRSQNFDFRIVITIFLADTVFCRVVIFTELFNVMKMLSVEKLSGRLSFYWSFEKWECLFSFHFKISGIH